MRIQRRRRENFIIFAVVKIRNVHAKRYSHHCIYCKNFQHNNSIYMLRPSLKIEKTFENFFKKKRISSPMDDDDENDDDGSRSSNWESKRRKRREDACDAFVSSLPSSSTSISKRKLNSEFTPREQIEIVLHAFLMSTNNGSSSVCEAHKSLKLLEERHKVLTLSEETRATLFNHLRKMANADAIEVRDILHVLKGTNKEKSTWKTERMDEKMSTVLKLLYAMRESPRAWVIGEKSVERFIEALVENFEHRRRGREPGEEKSETDGEDGEKKFWILRSDDDYNVWNYMETVRSMVKSLRLAAHPNTLLLMSSAASFAGGSGGDEIDGATTTADRRAHENRGEGEHGGDGNDDDDDNERNKVKNKTDEELEEDERVEQYRAGYKNLENNRCASSARAFAAIFEQIQLRWMHEHGSEILGNEGGWSLPEDDIVFQKEIHALIEEINACIPERIDSFDSFANGLDANRVWANACGFALRKCMEALEDKDDPIRAKEFDLLERKMRGSIDSRLVALAVVEGMFLKGKEEKEKDEAWNGYRNEIFFLEPSQGIILAHDILKCIANTRIVMDDDGDDGDDDGDDEEEEETDENSDHHQKRSDCIVNVGMDALRALAVKLDSVSVQAVLKSWLEPRLKSQKLHLGGDVANENDKNNNNNDEDGKNRNDDFSYFLGKKQLDAMAFAMIPKSDRLTSSAGFALVRASLELSNFLEELSQNVDNFNRSVNVNADKKSETVDVHISDEVAYNTSSLFATAAALRICVIDRKASEDDSFRRLLALVDVEACLDARTRQKADLELCRIPASKWVAACSRCLKNSEPLLNKMQSGNSIIDDDDKHNDSYSERMIAERRVSITKRAAQAIAKAASNGSSSMPPDNIAHMLVTSKCLRLCSEVASSLAGGKLITTPASGAKSTPRVMKNDDDDDDEISFLSLPKESRAAMVGACISLLNCAYLLPANTYARQSIWDAMFATSGRVLATKWALERANEWNDLRAINPALRFAAALDDDTSLMLGRSTFNLKNVDEEEQRQISIQTSRNVAIAHVVAAAWSNGVDDEASMDRENYAVKEDDVLHAISAISRDAAFARSSSSNTHTHNQMASFLTIFTNEDEDEASNNARATFASLRGRAELVSRGFSHFKKKAFSSQNLLSLYKTAMHFCLASAASADSSILDEGKGGGNLDPDARTIVNDRGALSPGAVVLVASETIEALSDEIRKCESGDQQQSKDQSTTIADAEMVCLLFLDGLRAVRVVCELEVPGPVMAGRLAMASASTLLSLSVVFAKFSNQNLQDIARRKNMLEMCIQGIDALIDCKAVYASPRRCKALLDAATAAAKRTSALSAEEMISQANTTTTTTAPTTIAPAVNNDGSTKEKKMDISRSFDARRLRRKRRINRGGRVKMSASSKRREQQSALQRSGAVGRKRSRDIRNYEVASDSDGTDDDDDYYDDDGEEGNDGGGYGAAAIMEEFEPSDIDESDDDDSDDNNDNNDGGFGMRGGGITGWG